jgi:hypothetical protein
MVGNVSSASVGVFVWARLPVSAAQPVAAPLTANGFLYVVADTCRWDEIERMGEASVSARMTPASTSCGTR